MLSLTPFSFFPTKQHLNCNDSLPAPAQSTEKTFLASAGLFSTAQAGKNVGSSSLNCLQSSNNNRLQVLLTIVSATLGMVKNNLNQLSNPSSSLFSLKQASP